MWKTAENQPASAGFFMSVSEDTTSLVLVEESEPHFLLSIEYPVKMTRTVSLRPDLPEDRFLPMLETCAEIYNQHTAWCAGCN